MTYMSSTQMYYPTDSLSFSVNQQRNQSTFQILRFHNFCLTNPCQTLCSSLPLSSPVHNLNFFSESTEPIGIKLCRNVQQMVLYKGKSHQKQETSSYARKGGSVFVCGQFIFYPIFFSSSRSLRNSPFLQCGNRFVMTRVVFKIPYGKQNETYTNLFLF